MLVLRETGDPVQIVPSRIGPFSLAELRIKPKHAELDFFAQSAAEDLHVGSPSRMPTTSVSVPAIGRPEA